MFVADGEGLDSCGHSHTCSHRVRRAELDTVVTGNWVTGGGNKKVRRFVELHRELEEEPVRGSAPRLDESGISRHQFNLQSHDNNKISS